MTPSTADLRLFSPIEGSLLHLHSVPVQGVLHLLPQSISHLAYGNRMRKKRKKRKMMRMKMKMTKRIVRRIVTMPPMKVSILQIHVNSMFNVIS